MNRKRLMKWMASVMLIGALFAPVSHAVTPLLGTTVVYAANDDDDDELKEATLYKVASELANAFSQGLAALADENGDDKKAEALLTFAKQSSGRGAYAGNAGGAVGYADDPTGKLDLGTKVKNWINSINAANSMSYSYKALSNVAFSRDTNDAGMATDSTDAFIAYADYGRALSDLGYMKQSAPGTNSMVSSLGRMIFGAIVMVLYVLALVVPVLFSLTIKLLLLLNPYQWLAKGLSVVGDYSEPYISIMKSYMGASGNNNWFDTAMNQFSDIYAYIANFGVISIILMAGWTVFTIFAFARSRNTKSRLMKILIRLMVSVLAVPLIGGSYTAMLEYLDQTASDKNAASYVNYVMASSFIRVDDWIENTRLAAPSTSGLNATNASESLIKINPKNMKVDSTTADARKVALAINSMSATSGSSWAKDVFDTYYGGGANSTPNGTVFDSVSDDKINDVTYDSKNTKDGSWSASFGKLANKRSVKWNFDTLLQFMGNAHYDAAAYDSFVKGTIHSRGGNSAMVNLLSLEQDKLSVGDGKATYLFSDSAQSGGKKDDFYKKGVMERPYNIYNNGSLTFRRSGDYWAYVDANGAASSINGALQTAHLSTSPIQGFGLSDVAMYNFLNTDFGDSSMTVYSTKVSASGYSRGQYLTVVIPGRGIDMALLYLETCTILAMFIVVGFVFWYGMIKTVFSTLFGVLFNAFGAVFGSLTIAGKLLLYTVLGAGQLVIAMVAYATINDVLTSFIQFSSAVASGNVSMTGSAMVLPLGAIGLEDLTLSVSIIGAITRIITIILLILVTMGSIYAYRKRVADAFAEIMTNWITKLTSRVDQLRGGDGSAMANQLSNVHAKNKARRDGKADDSFAKDKEEALKNIREQDRLDRGMGKKGKSNLQMQAEAAKEALRMKKDRLHDHALGRNDESAAGRVNERLAQRQMDLEDKKSDYNDARNARREAAKQMAMNSAQAEAFADSQKKSGAKKFGDVDAAGRANNTMSEREKSHFDDITSEESLRDNVRKTDKDIKEATASMDSAKRRQSEAHSELSSAEAVYEEAQSNEQAVRDRADMAKNDVSKAKSRVANAQKHVEDAERRLARAEKTGDAGAIEQARLGLENANDRYDREWQNYGNALNEQGLLTDSVEVASAKTASAKSNVDTAQKKVAAADADYDKASRRLADAQGNKWAERLGAKRLVSNGGAVVPTAMAQYVDANGQVQQGFSGNIDTVNAQLQQLYRSSNEAEAVLQRSEKAEQAGDMVLANSLRQDYARRQSSLNEQRQTLATSGVTGDLSNSDAVLATAQQLNSDFNSFASAGLESSTQQPLRRNEGKQQRSRRHMGGGQSTETVTTTVQDVVDPMSVNVQERVQTIGNGQTPYGQVNMSSSGESTQGQGAYAQPSLNLGQLRQANRQRASFSEPGETVQASLQNGGAVQSAVGQQAVQVAQAAKVLNQETTGLNQAVAAGTMTVPSSVAQYTGANGQVQSGFRGNTGVVMAQMSRLQKQASKAQELQQTIQELRADGAEAYADMYVDDYQQAQSAVNEQRQALRSAGITGDLSTPQAIAQTQQQFTADVGSFMASHAPSLASTSRQQRRLTRQRGGAQQQVSVDTVVNDVQEPSVQTAVSGNATTVASNSTGGTVRNTSVQNDFSAASTVAQPQQFVTNVGSTTVGQVRPTTQTSRQQRNVTRQRGGVQQQVSVDTVVNDVQGPSVQTTLSGATTVVNATSGGQILRNTAVTGAIPAAQTTAQAQSLADVGSAVVTGASAVTQTSRRQRHVTRQNGGTNEQVSVDTVVTDVQGPSTQTTVSGGTTVTTSGNAGSTLRTAGAQGNIPTAQSVTQPQSSTVNVGPVTFNQASSTVQNSRQQQTVTRQNGGTHHQVTVDTVVNDVYEPSTQTVRYGGTQVVSSGTTSGQASYSIPVGGVNTASASTTSAPRSTYHANVSSRSVKGTQQAAEIVNETIDNQIEERIMDAKPQEVIVNRTINDRVVQSSGSQPVAKPMIRVNTRHNTVSVGGDVQPDAKPKRTVTNAQKPSNGLKRRKRK